MTECIICGDKNVNEYKKVTDPHLGNDYTLYKCSGCKSRFFDPNEHPLDLKSFNEDVTQNDHHIYSEFVKNPYWSKEVERISHMVERPVESVLDVGCRTGDFLMHWGEGVRRVGVELTKSSADVAKSRGLDVIESPLEDVVSDEKFDVVTCYAILEHLYEPQKVIESLLTKVKPGGVLVVMIPSFENFKVSLLDSISYRWHQYCPPQHFCFYSKDFLDETASNKGYKLLDRIYTSGGMFNPFAKIPYLSQVFQKVMLWLDMKSPLNKVALFDHQYSYYLKED